MGKLTRTYLSEQMAGLLKKDIAQGAWGDRFPGYRVLQERYSVSKITCERALKILELEGLLSPSEPGKRRRILKQATGNAIDKGVGTLLMVFDIAHEVCPEILELMGDCARFWEERGGHVRRQVVDILMHRNPTRLIADWVEDTDCTAILLHEVPQCWVDAAEETAIPVFRFGGERGSMPLRGSMTGHSVAETYADIFTYLREKGHRRVLFPLRKSNVQTLRYAAEIFSEVYGKKLNASEIKQIFPVLDFRDTDDWHRFWKTRMPALQASVVILEHPHELISLLSYCNSMRLVIPDDLSVFVVEGGPLISWFTPGITHMEFNPKRELKQFFKWVERGMTPLGFINCPLPLVEGSSVAAI